MKKLWCMTRLRCGADDIHSTSHSTQYYLCPSIVHHSVHTYVLTRWLSLTMTHYFYCVISTCLISNPDTSVSVKVNWQSFVWWQGEVKKLCPVVIIDDTLYEEEEKFLVELISYKGSQVNSQYSTTEVIISPDRQDGKKTWPSNHLIFYFTEFVINRLF